ncbi:hypothetical protein BH11MYX1_BH11MYX1_54370 [soil metagenome]
MLHKGLAMLPTKTPRRFVLAPFLCAALLSSAACSNSQQQPPPPVDDTQGRAPASGNAPPADHHMSTKSKVVVLAGAAALYYLYKHHQNAAPTQQGEAGQYYLSKNGRVYYRDAEHRAHWVTPPAQGIQVPAEEAGAYSKFQGYDNSTTGRDLADLGSDPE